MQREILPLSRANQEASPPVRTLQVRETGGVPPISDFPPMYVLVVFHVLDQPVRHRSGMEGVIYRRAVLYSTQCHLLLTPGAA